MSLPVFGRLQGLLYILHSAVVTLESKQSEKQAIIAGRFAKYGEFVMDAAWPYEIVQTPMSMMATLLLTWTSSFCSRET